MTDNPTPASELERALELERGLTPREVAKMLGIAEVTLQQMRARVEGPRFYKLGRRAVRYRLADVLAYRDARMVGRQP